MTEQEIAQLDLEHQKMIFEVVKWIIISIAAIISFWIIDVGKLRLERKRSSNENKLNLLNAYLKATEVPNPDLWLRKLRLIKALSDKNVTDMKSWAIQEEQYIIKVSALVVLYKETMKVASVLANRDQYLSDEWKKSRNRFYELYHGELVFYKESEDVEDAMVAFKDKLEAIDPGKEDDWNEMDQELLNLVITLSAESEKLKSGKT